VFRTGADQGQILMPSKWPWAAASTSRTTISSERKPVGQRRKLADRYRLKMKAMPLATLAKAKTSSAAVKSLAALSIRPQPSRFRIRPRHWTSPLAELRRPLYRRLLIARQTGGLPGWRNLAQSHGDRGRFM